MPPSVVVTLAEASTMRDMAQNGCSIRKIALATGWKRNAVCKALKGYSKSQAREGVIAEAILKLRKMDPHKKTIGAVKIESEVDLTKGQIERCLRRCEFVGRRKVVRIWPNGRTNPFAHLSTEDRANKTFPREYGSQ